MSTEQVFVYLFIAALALVQFFARLKRLGRAGEREHDTATEPVSQERDARFPDRKLEAPPPEHPSERLPRPARPPALAAKAIAPAPRLSAQATRPPPAVRPKPAWKVRIEPGNRAELRRAVALMTILGPPRSQTPRDP
jgi:hypothetical protein